MRIEMFPTHRRHTYHFLNKFYTGSTVHLSVRVNMQKVEAHRKKAMEESEQKISYVSYIIWAVSRVLKQFPQANASLHDGFFFPRIVHYDEVHAKITFDKMVSKHRIVMSSVIRNTDRQSLKSIQSFIDNYRDKPMEDLPEFESLNKLQTLPIWAGKYLYNMFMSGFKCRFDTQGSFTVTSLGHRDIQDFYPIISTTTCFGVGGIQDTPVVQNGEIVIRPMVQISLSFDHLLLDGAISADILTAVKEALEKFEETVE